MLTAHQLLNNVHVGNPERGRGPIIAEGSEEDLGVRGDPGINSSLPINGKCLTMLATDMFAQVHII